MIPVNQTKTPDTDLIVYARYDPPLIHDNEPNEEIRKFHHLLEQDFVSPANFCPHFYL